MTPDRPRTPTRRADAERNREKVLAAAREAFADAGAEVSMAEVARRAGVGMATLYRNFPGRRDLLEALYTGEVDAVVAAAAAAEGDDPAARLDAWLRRFVAFSASKGPIASELLTHVDAENPVFDGSRSRVLAAGRPLLEAAQAAGDVRDDLTLEQVLDMLIAIARVPGGPEYTAAIVATALAGLRRA